MKRSPLKRGKPLQRGTKRLARVTRLRRVGRRGREVRSKINAVRDEVLARAGGRCARFRKRRRLELHHRLSRARGGGHAAANLAPLCKPCHSGVTDHTAPDWRAWLVSTKPRS